MKDADFGKEVREATPGVTVVNPLQSLNEVKLKHLEARLIGPNSEGTLPVIVKPGDLDEIKFSK